MGAETFKSSDKYFRIGLASFIFFAHHDRPLIPFHNRHMGITVVDSQRGDIDKIINSLRESLAEAMAGKKQ